MNNRSFTVSFDEALPINQHREKIAETIANNQVVVICGETGSGKTTQLPKICLTLGLAEQGMIGHTQPRRIAARSVAARIAEELQTPLGGLVGYQVRFTDNSSADTRIKLMTDGVLLAETQGDKRLSRYSVIIIDEAHERSLNIDFLLGYLHRLLPRRRDLKVIITSATIDPHRFSRHFNNAPVIEVSGRGYPVDIRYCPPVGDRDDGDDVDLPGQMLTAVEDIRRLGSGDILVFLSGERDIRDVQDRLQRQQWSNCEIAPLFGRLSMAEQQRIFKPHSGRRIVLATNVAETSLTVPGIRFVVDAGTARISRYSHRSKVQRLPVEAISQASAAQRAGRCGRVGPGICIRLYDQADFLQRPGFTDPEIQRTNLAAVILQMLDLKLGQVEDFPFIDPPEQRMINDGYQLLFELQAVDDRKKLTRLGQRLARLPVDPRLGRMILASERHGCLQELLVLTAFLSIQDPRERPLNKQQAADEKHRLFRDSRSDFITITNLWKNYREQAKVLSGKQLRQWCRNHFLAWMRMREWQALYGELQRFAGRLGLKTADNAAADYGSLHKALLTGLLNHVGLKQEDHRWLGPRNRQFYLFPGSGLAKKGPKWLLAAELVETSRLYARTLAAIEPEWLESLASHLLKRHYHDPHWSKSNSRVSAFLQATLYGLPVIEGRRINYGPMDPETARTLFIRHALVRGEFNSKAKFFLDNQRLVAELEDLEAKSRRRDVVLDEPDLEQLYEQRLPMTVYDGPSLHKWLNAAEPEALKKLLFSEQDVLARSTDDITGEQFPDTLTMEGMQLPLSYCFEPGHEADGVTVTIPVAALGQVQPPRLEWLVPGLLEERIIALLKGLPKTWRRQLVPVPNYARAIMSAIVNRSDLQVTPLTAVISDRVRRMTGIRLPDNVWREDGLSDHLKMRIRVVDEQNKVLMVSRSFVEVRSRFADSGKRHFEKMSRREFESREVDDWDFGSLEPVDFQREGIRYQGWPALAVNKGKIMLALFDSELEARQAMMEGLTALIAVKLGRRWQQRSFPEFSRMCLHFAALGNRQQLQQDLQQAILRQAFLADGCDVRDEASFQRCLEVGQERLSDTVSSVCRQVAAALNSYHEIARQVSSIRDLRQMEAARDIRDQLQHLVYVGFICRTPAEWLPHLPRYLKAAALRLEKLSLQPDRDRQRQMQVEPHWQRCRSRLQDPGDECSDEAFVFYRWMVEEWRVSLFAQELKTALPVSEKRLQAQWQQVKAGK